MVSVFCTLFDSNYLDKGLALYWSMKNNMEKFRLYIFAFDDKCYEVLLNLHLERVIVIPISDIMTTTLQQLQTERTRAEFCWTCTPIVIEHVLLKCNESICTYIDADIYFFDNPHDLIQEIIEDNCSVGLVRHGFERDYGYGEWIFRVGKYCIEFNTFLNNKEGLQVLDDWKKDCIDWCYDRFEDGKLGDQKYSDKWKLKYSCVHESGHLGAGVAPWNIHLYNYLEVQNNRIWLQYRKRKFKLIFYHFEGMKYLNNGKIYLNLWNPSGYRVGKKVSLIYGEYIKKIESIRDYLEKSYDVTFDHMIIDKKTVLGRNNSLKQFFMADGFAKGLMNWTRYRCNGYRWR